MNGDPFIPDKRSRYFYAPRTRVSCAHGIILSSSSWLNDSLPVFHPPWRRNEEMRGWEIREEGGKLPIGDDKHLSNARPRTFSDYQRQVSLLSQGSLPILFFLRETSCHSVAERRTIVCHRTVTPDRSQLSVFLLFSVKLLGKHHDLFGMRGKTSLFSSSFSEFSPKWLIVYSFNLNSSCCSFPHALVKEWKCITVTSCHLRKISRVKLESFEIYSSITRHSHVSFKLR